MLPLFNKYSIRLLGRIQFLMYFFFTILSGIIFTSFFSLSVKKGKNPRSALRQQQTVEWKSVANTTKNSSSSSTCRSPFLPRGPSRTHDRAVVHRPLAVQVQEVLQHPEAWRDLRVFSLDGKERGSQRWNFSGILIVFWQTLSFEKGQLYQLRFVTKKVHPLNQRCPTLPQFATCGDNPIKYIFNYW